MSSNFKANCYGFAAKLYLSFVRCRRPEKVGKHNVSYPEILDLLSDNEPKKLTPEHFVDPLNVTAVAVSVSAANAVFDVRG